MLIKVVVYRPLLFIFMFMLFSSFGTKQNIERIDSLQNLVRVETNDREKAKYLNQLAFEYTGINPKKARLYAGQAYGIARELNLKEDLAETLRIFGFLNYIQSDYDKALEYLLNALKLFKKFDNQQGIANTKYDIGLIYQRQGSSQNALTQFQKSLEMFQELNYHKGTGICLYRIAQVKSEQNPSEALQDYYKALEICDMINEKRQKAVVLNGISIILRQQKKYEQALEKCLESATINQEIGEKKGLAESYIAAGELYLLKNDLQNAVRKLLEALNISKEIGANDIEIEAYKLLSKYYEAKNNPNIALRYYKQYTALKEYIFTKQKSGQIAEMKARYDSEQKEKENKLLKQTQELNKKTIQRQNAITIAVVLTLISVAFIAFSAHRKREAVKAMNLTLRKQNREISWQKDEVSKKNDELENQRLEISEQRNLLHRQNTKMTDSIRYAQTIQHAILPTNVRMNELFSDYFILYKPRDIVSGDFYWVEKIRNQLFIAVVDCTGHGIPGAFMSLIGYSSLNEIVLKISDPAQILDSLNQSIKKALKQGKSSDNTDGMDVSLCRIEKLSDAEQQLVFCGAKQSVYYIKPKERVLTELRGDRISIGGNFRKTKTFKNQELIIPNGDIIVLLSDGYADQNNHKKDKFGFKRLKRVLAMNSYLPLADQKQFLENLLKAHIEKEEQRDDITVIGIKI